MAKGAIRNLDDLGLVTEAVYNSRGVGYCLPGPDAGETGFLTFKKHKETVLVIECEVSGVSEASGIISFLNEVFMDCGLPEFSTRKVGRNKISWSR